MKNFLLFNIVLLIFFISCSDKSINKKIISLEELSDYKKIVSFEKNQAVVFKKDFIIPSRSNSNLKPFSFQELYIPKNAVMFEPSLKDLIDFETKLHMLQLKLSKNALSLNWNDTTRSNLNILWDSQAESVYSKGLLKQYWGYIENSGDSILFGTFLSQTHAIFNNAIIPISEQWTKAPIFIDDGGPEFYTSKYNLSQDTLIYIMVNGI